MMMVLQTSIFLNYPEGRDVTDAKVFPNVQEVDMTHQQLMSNQLQQKLEKLERWICFS